jgi:hypothetical protein
MKRSAKATRKCRRCPLRASSGRCLNPVFRSGKCGDWIWSVRGGKQHRRRYARPKDPCTLAQPLCRARFKTASRRYSRSLTEEERVPCMAAGAKLRSRSRHAQRGPLTGQQYWVRQDSAQAKVKVKPTKAKTAPQLLQPEKVTRSTSDQYRIYTGHTPSIHRLGAVQARKGRSGRGLGARILHAPRDSPTGRSRRRQSAHSIGSEASADCRRRLLEHGMCMPGRRVKKPAPPSCVLRKQKATGSAWRRRRSPPGARRWRMAGPARKAVAPPGHAWRTPRVARNTVAIRRR